jgi:predicted PhzF superfamily epimerase YddE/YHI9
MPPGYAELVSAPMLEVVRVFVSAPGRGGNPLGVFLDASAFSESDYQRVAADLGFSETVFVEDRREARLRIFTPTLELPLAGHPLVGTSWLMHREGSPPDVLRPPAGEIPTWESDGATWIRADPSKAPRFDFVELGDADEVEALDGSPDGGGRTVAWAWVDRPAGVVRARAFLPDYGVAEDEATGAAALRLCALLDQPLEIKQGAASHLETRPAATGEIELGGRTEAVERRPYEPTGWPTQI